jgi:hypothetical protein
MKLRGAAISVLILSACEIIAKRQSAEKKRRERERERERERVRDGEGEK